MDKFYRVKKDTFLWKEGALLKNSATSSYDSDGGYQPIEDIWNVTKEQKNEYITARIIEAPENADYFERVYPDTIKGSIYRTADQLKEMYQKSFK